MALRAKREEIAAHVALELGLGDLKSLSAADRATVEQQTAETIEGCGMDAEGASDCSDADRTMRRLLSEHRALAGGGGPIQTTRLEACWPDPLLCKRHFDMDTRGRLLGWIGAVAGLIGFWVFNFAPVSDLLPLNQALFTVLCTLLVIWLLDSVSQIWGSQT
ncbi:hypothetical protein ASF41_23375 [Methylobacterium sp. Leaf111]|nr:hypothetical protein ASF41_23375 [Methylobacterium sp. Leaf111]